jgi:CheY-like chemotaxis protein
MIRIREISLPPEHNPAQLGFEAAKLLRISNSKIRQLRIVRRSIDARKKPDVKVVYTIDVAVDGKEALDIFTMSKQGAYEAIIMDVMMPNMDGITATRHIRSSEHKDAISIPIIAMTANAFEEDIKKTKEVGMNAHISKPLNPTVLFSELMRIKREKSREECIV